MVGFFLGGRSSEVSSRKQATRNTVAGRGFRAGRNAETLVMAPELMQPVPRPLAKSGGTGCNVRYYVHNRRVGLSGSFPADYFRSIVKTGPYSPPCSLSSSGGHNGRPRVSSRCAVGQPGGPRDIYFFFIFFDWPCRSNAKSPLYSTQSPTFSQVVQPKPKPFFGFSHCAL